MSNFEDKYKNWHQKTSYIKSAVRMAGCVIALALLPNVNLSVLSLVVCLFVAELLGIVEEWM